MAQLATEVDLDFSKNSRNEVDFPTPSPKVEVPEISEVALWLNENEENEEIAKGDEVKLAETSGTFPMNEKLIEETAQLLHQWIKIIEKEMVNTGQKQNTFRF